MGANFRKLTIHWTEQSCNYRPIMWSLRDAQLAYIAIKGRDRAFHGGSRGGGDR